MTAARIGIRSRPDPWKTAFFVLAAVALVVGIAWGLLGSSFLVVRSVRITGLGPMPRQQVLAAARVRIGTPLIRVDTGAVARRVARLTLVQSASVRRSWPNAIVITMVRRTPLFAVRAGRRYNVLDGYGVVLGHISRPGDGLVLLRPADQGTTVRGSAVVRAAGIVVRGLPAWLRHKLTAVRTRGSVVILMLRPGITVVWGGVARAAAKAQEVAVLLRTKATYYDVSDPQSATTGWPGRSRALT